MNGAFAIQKNLSSCRMAEGIFFFGRTPDVHLLLIDRCHNVIRLESIAGRRALTPSTTGLAPTMNPVSPPNPQCQWQSTIDERSAI